MSYCALVYAHTHDTTFDTCFIYLDLPIHVNLLDSEFSFMFTDHFSYLYYLNHITYHVYVCLSMHPT